MTLRTGKLPPELLKKLLKNTGAKDPRVVLGPRIGEDAAIVKLGGQLLVLKTDPVTYASDMIGWYAVNVNANDIATRGARPAWFQAVVLLPPGSEERLAEGIFKQISDAAKELDIAVTGGHTEVTPGISSPIVVGDMHGVLDGDEPVLTSGARVGDSIVLTKGAGIEGTAAIARERRKDLLKAFGKAFVDRAANFLFEPGLSILPEARLAVKHNVRAMHDPTEGGVSMGIYELGAASGKSVELVVDHVVVLPETERICEKYGLDPLGLLGSGALIATFRQVDAESFVRDAKKHGIDATVVGKVLSKKDRSKAIVDGKVTPLSFSERDEILRVLGQ
jgi:hydrogenase expression/formation protein HypE